MSVQKNSMATKLAFLAVIVAFFVIALGAFTRLADAGLGCPDWPTCYGHILWPTSEAQIEVANSNSAYNVMFLGVSPMGAYLFLPSPCPYRNKKYQATPLHKFQQNIHKQRTEPETESSTHTHPERDNFRSTQMPT